MPAALRTSPLLLAAILAAGGLACRKPAPAAEPVQPVAQTPAKAVDQSAQADADQQRRAEEAEAARKAAAQAAQDAQAARLRKAAAEALQDVHFDFDQKTLPPDQKPILEGIADFMKHYPQATLLIDGNCDDRGTVEYNLALGEQRAHTVQDYLVGLGVSTTRLSSISYGKEKPLCTQATEACWHQNRRAHFTLK